MKNNLALAAIVSILLGSTSAAYADQLVDQYNAYIGQDDLYNSNGERLTQPWQIIRQDRANFHKFGINQRGDEDDGFFDSVDNRAAAERMIRDGAMTRAARALLLDGDVMINVKIFEGPDGDYLTITVD
ncbi:hypothetical protein JJB09_13735 [Rhizobium sp. KVB221]|uniref:Uncharacterized protein n=2 Tax=Rhizobium setariae TaxID=2801340 RepID=A0A936YR83_9HYPH|nr:hypothetical protein [Rhizobium setariae]